MTDRWIDISPLATATEAVRAADLVAEGPVRYLLVSGELDAGGWGIIGAFWLSIDALRGGFVVSPEAIWLGSEMARGHQSARHRGWPVEEIYRWWQRQIGVAGHVMVDPQHHADTLLHVYRRVGAL